MNTNDRKSQDIRYIFKQTGVAYVENGTWRKFSSHPNLRRAWSDDESTVTSLSNSKNKNRLQPSDDETTILTNAPVNVDGLPSFQEWVKVTSRFTNMVSKQIHNCTTGAMGSLNDDAAFTLKDEDFFWSPHTQSFDTIDTRNTTEYSTFSHWNQNMNQISDSHRPILDERYRRHSHH